VYRFFKTLCDFLLALLLLVVLAPVLLVISLLVYLDVGFPILFRQQRPGRNEKIFVLYKFRTMRPYSLDCQSDQSRTTNLGGFLRKSSLDEIPSLFNVLCGDMSFVGPRPLLADYLIHYSREERIRHSVRPGITGLAQVKGRNSLGWDEKMKYDQLYIKKMSVGLDLLILCETAIKVLLGAHIDYSLENKPVPRNLEQ